MEGYRDSFFVGSWQVEPMLHRLIRLEQNIQVEPKLMQVLVYLAQHPGEVVTRDQLLDDLWPETVVTDHVLTRSISELRKALNDDRRSPTFIETIPKTGYRLIAPVQYPGDSSDGLPGEVHISASIALPIDTEGQTRPNRWILKSVLAVIFLAILGVGLVWMNVLPSEPSRATTTPLTSMPGQELSPIFSPDGERVAFVWHDLEGNADLHVRLVGTQSSLQLTQTPGVESDPAWSPGGRSIAFVRQDQDACGIYMIPALGGTEQKLIECESTISGLSWSPDGQYLVFSDRVAANTPRQLFVLSMETQERRKLTTPPSHFRGDLWPRFSPDGQRLAFIRARSENVADIFVLDIEDEEQEPRRLTTDHSSIVGFDWTPDGEHLVFSSNRSGLYRLWQISATGGETEPVEMISAWDPGLPVFARNSQRMAYVDWFYEVNIWRVSARESFESDDEAVRLIGSTRTDMNPQISPDGQRIAFISNRSGSHEVWVSEKDGTREVKLTALNKASTATPRWSPDGQSLVFVSRNEGQSDLYVIHADGGVPHRITFDAADEVMPSWSQDGQSLFFASSREGDWNIWKMPSEGGVATQVTENGGYVAFEAHDGASLYYTKATTSELWNYAYDQGTVTKALDAFPTGNWALVSEGIYYLASHNGTKTLEFFDFKTQQGSTLSSMPSGHFMGLTVAPDESWLLYAHLDRNETDVMLVDGLRID